MFKNILLAFDGSDHAVKAAHLAAELCKSGKADLRIVVAFDPIPPYLGEPNLQSAIDARMKDAEETIAAALKEVGKIPGKVSTELIEATPAEAVLSVATTRNVDLIVMGSRGLGRLVGLLLGSQSQKVVQHAPCPVLIVR